MKPKTQSILLTILIGSVFYYDVPFIAGLLLDTVGKSILVASLLLFNPLYCLLIGIFSAKNGFIWYMPLITAALFLPSVYIFYNDSALVYVLVYAVITLFGCFIGLFFRNKKRA